LAIVAPIFLLLMAGIIEFGQAFRVEHTLSSASRRAARMAIVDGATVSGVKQSVKSQCASALSVSQSDVTVNIYLNGALNGSLSGAAKGDAIKVTVSIPYNKAASSFYGNFFSQSTLSASCTLEHE
jgi:Flp pilus assembly protein TadG